ncbi:MAG: class I SAM-dependent methyltransferase [Candidatus Thermoplasmatota archaeon]|nr:class I SAM-dependent methyltransferase [Candidatus Thermoplasmatota archaeon]MBS3801649.1 class I SAM-dependent methyltransferase [Candidatus Thermoplasmatota archaeon]
MMLGSFDKIAFLYDWVEQRILKDHQGSVHILQTYLDVEKDDIIIDLGGGTGYVARYLATQAKQVLLIDPSKNLLSKGKKSPVHPVRGSATKIPCNSSSVSIIVLISVLHHIPKTYHEQVLSECKRVLDKHGVLCIIEAIPPESLLQKLFIHIEHVLVGKTFHRHPNELRNEVKKTGFQSVEAIFPKDHDWKYVIKAID